MIWQARLLVLNITNSVLDINYAVCRDSANLQRVMFVLSHSAVPFSILQRCQRVFLCPGSFAAHHFHPLVRQHVPVRHGDCLEHVVWACTYKTAGHTALSQPSLITEGIMAYPSTSANSLAAAALTTNTNCVCMQADPALVLCRLLLPWQL